MKTVVVQSYKTKDVPIWLSDCMGTVKEWAISNKFSYELIGDEFFNYIPAWMKERHALHPQTDYARLLALRERLNVFDRVIWMDADTFIFNAEKLVIPDREYLFTYERNLFCPDPSINNSFMMFTRKAIDLLELYITQSNYKLRNISRTFFAEIGPTLLRELSRKEPLLCATFNGLINLPVINAIYFNQKSVLTNYSNSYGYEQHMANLANSAIHFSVTEDERQIIVTKTLFAMRKLYETKGGILNLKVKDIPVISVSTPLR